MKNHNHEEYQYLQLIHDLIKDEKATTPDRTNVGTRMKFGVMHRWNLEGNNFPLLTTKKVFWKAVLHELLWFISGDTNAKTLSDKKVKIWDGNSSRANLDKLGFKDRKEGDCGPIYGFQMRHFGAEYKNCDTDYTGKGFDQLAEIIRLLKEDPFSRRIIMNCWNPNDLEKMALPPCHVLCEFSVSPEKELSCMMFQRSADLGLGVPFNIASYSLLTKMLAHCCDLKPKEFIHVSGKCTCLFKSFGTTERTSTVEFPKQFPELFINPDQKDFFKLKAEDFFVKGYEHYPSVDLELNV